MIDTYSDDGRGVQDNGQPMGQSQGVQRGKRKRRPQDGTREFQPQNVPMSEVISEGIPPAYQQQFSQQAPPQDNGIAARKALGGYAPVGNMMGFNTALDYPDDKAANSVKNTYGRIASRYDQNTPGFLQQILGDADFQRYFPNARLGPEEGRGGMIDFGGVLSDFESGVPVGLVDVAQSYENGVAKGHQWMDQSNGGGSPQQQPSMLGNDMYNQIQSMIMQPALGQGQGTDSNQILQLLQMLLQNQGGMQ